MLAKAISTSKVNKVVDDFMTRDLLRVCKVIINNDASFRWREEGYCEGIYSKLLGKKFPIFFP
jgi:hypothetical protein